MRAVETLKPDSLTLSLPLMSKLTHFGPPCCGPRLCLSLPIPRINGTARSPGKWARGEREPEIAYEIIVVAECKPARPVIDQSRQVGQTSACGPDAHSSCGAWRMRCLPHYCLTTAWTCAASCRPRQHGTQSGHF